MRRVWTKENSPQNHLPKKTLPKWNTLISYISNHLHFWHSSYNFGLSGELVKFTDFEYLRTISSHFI